MPGHFSSHKAQQRTQPARAAIVKKAKKKKKRITKCVQQFVGCPC